MQVLFDSITSASRASSTPTQSPLVDRRNDYMQDVLNLVLDPETGAQPKPEQKFMTERPALLPFEKQVT